MKVGIGVSQKRIIDLNVTLFSMQEKCLYANLVQNQTLDELN